MSISAVDAEMKRIPRQGCPEALPAVQKLAGLRIITGFTQKVKDLIGSVRGCSHLTNLFLTLGPAAVQGYWAAYGRKPGAMSLENPAVSRVIDSGHLWRKDGPYVQSLIAGAREKRQLDVLVGTFHFLLGIIGFLPRIRDRRDDPGLRSETPGRISGFFLFFELYHPDQRNPAGSVYLAHGVKGKRKRQRRNERRLTEGNGACALPVTLSPFSLFAFYPVIF